MPVTSDPHLSVDLQTALLERAVRVQAISVEITALENPEEIPHRVVEALVRELGLSVASLVLRDPISGSLRYVAEVGVPAEVKALGFRTGGTADTVLQTGQPLFVEDAAQDSRVSPQARPFFQAWACLPVRHRDRTYGLLFVNFPEAHPFPPIERHILGIFASQTAIALDNARLHQSERHRAAALATLAALGRDLSESLETPDLVRVLARALRDHLPRTTAEILWLREGEALRPAFALGLKLTAESLTAIPATASLIPPALGPHTGLRPLPLPSLFDEFKLPAEALPMGNWRALTAGLTVGSESQGVLVLLMPEEVEPFSAAELDFVQALVDRGALALHNANLYEQSIQAAHRDSLTQVLNHGTIQIRLEEALAEAQRTGQPLALLMLDADHFKRCNDTHGHAFGDRVLVALARTIKEQVRPTDLVGRWGGEEFTVVLPGVDGPVALRVAERIRTAMEALVIKVSESQFTAAPTISIGLASYPGAAETPSSLLEASDTALYAAKAQGRNRVCVAP
ncbi:MAG: sensor domain-containing diguanylate cyclase [Holophaga sp.]